MSAWSQFEKDRARDKERERERERERARQRELERIEAVERPRCQPPATTATTNSAASSRPFAANLCVNISRPAKGSRSILMYTAFAVRVAGRAGYACFSMRKPTQAKQASWTPGILAAVAFAVALAWAFQHDGHTFRCSPSGPLPELTDCRRASALRLEKHVRAVASVPHNLEHPEALETAARYIEDTLAAMGLSASAAMLYRRYRRACPGPQHRSRFQ